MASSSKPLQKTLSEIVPLYYVDRETFYTQSPPFERDQIVLGWQPPSDQPAQIIYQNHTCHLQSNEYLWSLDWDSGRADTYSHVPKEWFQTHFMPLGARSIEAHVGGQDWATRVDRHRSRWNDHRLHTAAAFLEARSADAAHVAVHPSVTMRPHEGGASCPIRPGQASWWKVYDRIESPSLRSSVLRILMNGAVLFISRTFRLPPDRIWWFDMSDTEEQQRRLDVLYQDGFLSPLDPSALNPDRVCAPDWLIGDHGWSTQITDPYYQTQSRA